MSLFAAPSVLTTKTRKDDFFKKYKDWKDRGNKTVATKHWKIEIQENGTVTLVGKARRQHSLHGRISRRLGTWKLQKPWGDREERGQYTITEGKPEEKTDPASISSHRNCWVIFLKG